MKADARQAARYFVSGRVQGVSFRWFTRKAAEAIGVTGYVRNLNDGRVEAIAIGTEEQLKAFKERIMEGPSYSKVAAIDEIPEEITTDLKSFEITY